MGLVLQPLGTAASFPTFPYWRFLPVVVVANEDFGGFSDERERTALSAKVLRLLQVQGMPLPLFSRIFISCKINEDKLY